MPFLRLLLISLKDVRLPGVPTITVAREYGPLAVKMVKPISTEEYPTPVKRPANSVLDCSLIGKNFAIQPKAWGESLKDMIHRLLSFKE